MLHTQGHLLYSTHMASKSHAEMDFSSKGFAEVKLTKYMKFSIGQLKCASNFMKQITSARRELSHAYYSSLSMLHGRNNQML